MILRVPDYYDEFQCIAGACKDSCCIGWEIDIDEDTCAYYRSIRGPFGDRLRGQIYTTEEGDQSFRLGEQGRCPFLNQENLCDIITELGEEALSEVCTEYPRFSLYYGDVLQKCLSLSCEEVGRILFTREEPVTFVDHTMEGPDWEEEDDADDADLVWAEDDEEIDEALIERMVSAQNAIIAILQNRSDSIAIRIGKIMEFGEKLQKELNNGEENDTIKNSTEVSENLWAVDADHFSKRLAIFLEMETLDHEWEEQKDLLVSLEKDPNYGQKVEAFLQSDGYKEQDYENLLVYFVFRYFMNAVYDNNALSKLRMAVEFTLMIRDMDALRFAKQQHYSITDRIDVVRIFSKEVEHSEENVAMAEEELLWMTK